MGTSVVPVAVSTEVTVPLESAVTVPVLMAFVRTTYFFLACNPVIDQAICWPTADAVMPMVLLVEVTETGRAVAAPLRAVAPIGWAVTVTELVAVGTLSVAVL